MDATYKRWKYMVQNGREISPELDALMLDRMDGVDYDQLPLSEMPCPGEREDIGCTYCGGAVMVDKLGWALFVKMVERGNVPCFVPPACEDCRTKL